MTNFKVKIRIQKESYQDLLVGKPATYSPFRPGMTATVDIITTRKERVLGVPISAIVVKSDTAAVEKMTVDDIEKKEKQPVSKSDQKYECVFVKSGDKVKISVIKTGIQDDTNIEVISGLKKGETIIIGPYTTVTKDLNSGDRIVVRNPSDKLKEEE